MNSPATDLARHLESQGVGSLGLGTIGPGAGTGIFVGEMPPEPSEAVTVYAYAGDADDTLVCAPIDRFRIQIRVRARSYEDAWALAMKVEEELDRLTTLSVPDSTQTVEYVVVNRVGPVSELGKDEKRRTIMSQNYTGIRQLI